MRGLDELRRRAWGAREGLLRLGSKTKIKGEGNQLDFGKARLRGVCIEIQGNHNRVRVHPTCRLVNTSFHLLGNNLSVELDERVKISSWAEFRMIGDGAAVRIGRETTVESARFIAHGNSTLEIGPDCMLAYDIELRTSDSHSILEAATGERINPDKGISIGEHVWLGARSVVLKGVAIGGHSIVATGSIVSKDIAPGVLAGGIPARMIKDGVTWDRRRL